MKLKSRNILKKLAIIISVFAFMAVLTPSLNSINTLKAEAAEKVYETINKGCGNFTHTYKTSTSRTSYSISDKTLGRVYRTESNGVTTYTISSIRPNTSSGYEQTFAVYIKNSSGKVIKCLTFNQAAPVVKLNKTSATVNCDSDQKVTVRVTTNANVGISRIYGSDAVGKLSQTYINGQTDNGRTNTYYITFTSNRNDYDKRTVVYLFQFCGAYETCSITQSANDGFVYKDKWYSPGTVMTGARPICVTSSHDPSISTTKHYTVSKFNGNAYGFGYYYDDGDGYKNISNDELQAAAIANGIDIEYHQNYTGDLYVTIDGRRLKYATIESNVYGDYMKIVPINYPTDWWKVST